MAQRRYRDWKAPVMSKDSVENVAILNGIGPVFGWDRCSIQGNNLHLSTQVFWKSRKTITTRDGAVEMIYHSVITPDGILTAFTDQSEIIQNIPAFGPTREYIVYATHVYTESEISSSTTLACKAVTGDTSILNQLKASSANMETWKNVVIDPYQIDESTSVVIGVFKWGPTGNSPIDQAIPYNYSWSDGVSTGGYDGAGSIFELKDGSILTRHLANGSVTAEKLAPNAVFSPENVLRKSFRVFRLHVNAGHGGSPGGSVSYTATGDISKYSVQVDWAIPNSRLRVKVSYAGGILAIVSAMPHADSSTDMAEDLPNSTKYQTAITFDTPGGVIPSLWWGFGLLIYPVPGVPTMPSSANFTYLCMAYVDDLQ